MNHSLVGRVSIALGVGMVCFGIAIAGVTETEPSILLNGFLFGALAVFGGMFILNGKHLMDDEALADECPELKELHDRYFEEVIRVKMERKEKEVSRREKE